MCFVNLQLGASFSSPVTSFFCEIMCLKLSPLARRFVVGCMEGWVVGWIGLWVQRFHFTMGWVLLGQSFDGLG